MARRKQSSSSNEAFIPNRHVFLTGIMLMIATIGLVVYDFSIGETIFDGAQVQVLGEQATPTPSVPPTTTP